MAKTTKLSEEEVKQLNDIQAKHKAVVEEFGKIKILELNLIAREERAEKFLEDLQTLEVELAKTLEDKYGKGTVNLESGDFNALGK